MEAPYNFALTDGPACGSLGVGDGEHASAFGQTICRCGEPECRGEWQPGCGLGLSGILDEGPGYSEIEVISDPLGAAYDADTNESMQAPMDLAPLVRENESMERLLLRAASALAPFRRRQTAFLGESEASAVFDEIVEHLGDRCPLKLHVLTLSRA